MASLASNFCLDAADPCARTMWWAGVLAGNELRMLTPYRPSTEAAAG